MRKHSTKQTIHCKIIHAQLSFGNSETIYKFRAKTREKKCLYLYSNVTNHLTVLTDMTRNVCRTSTNKIISSSMNFELILELIKSIKKSCLKCVSAQEQFQTRLVD